MKNINPETSKRFLHSPKVMDNIDSPEVRAANPDIVDVATRPVDIDSDRLGGVLHVRVGVAKPQFEAPRSTIIMPVAWSDSPEHRFQQQRSQLMADVTGGQVLTIGFPGMGGEYNDPHNQLSEKDLEEIRHGRLSTYARGVWQALEQNNDELLSDGSGNRLPVGLWLNSLGTLVGSELLATAPEGMAVSDVYLLIASTNIRLRILAQRSKKPKCRSCARPPARQSLIIGRSKRLPVVSRFRFCMKLLLMKTRLLPMIRSFMSYEQARVW